MLRKRWLFTSLAGGLLLLALAAGCASRRPARESGGLFVLRWIERPAADGPAGDAAPADRVRFEKVLAYDRSRFHGFQTVKPLLREGDVIAYRMPPRAVRRRVLTGHFNSIGYGLLQYGHLAIVVRAPENPALPGRPAPLRLFSSQSFIGPNTREDLDTLKEHDWDAYRLDRWERVDTARLHEFVRLVEQKAGRWYGYDFSGMFGLWNSNPTPREPRRIGRDYICSTVVLAALYYSGVQLDAMRNKGYLDLCTPLQVVNSSGRILPPPDVSLATADAPTHRTTRTTVLPRKLRFRQGWTKH